MLSHRVRIQMARQARRSAKREANRAKARKTNGWFNKLIEAGRVKGASMQAVLRASRAEQEKFNRQQTNAKNHHRKLTPEQKRTRKAKELAHAQ